MKTGALNTHLRRILVGATLLALVGSSRADFTGTSTGIFTNPVGPVDMVTTGVGTSSFTWGDGSAFGSPPSSLSFTSAAFSTPAEVPFLVGVLSYYNGTIALGTEANTVDLLLTLDFTSPAGVSQAFAYNLGLITTPNGSGTPQGDADIVTIPSVANASFTDGINTYTLHLEFTNFSASSFGGPNEFRVFEGERATADVMGTITTDLTGVPDNGSTLALLGLGLAAAGLIRRRRAA